MDGIGWRRGYGRGCGCGIGEYGRAWGGLG